MKYKQPYIPHLCFRPSYIPDKVTDVGPVFKWFLALAHPSRSPIERLLVTLFCWNMNNVHLFTRTSTQGSLTMTCLDNLDLNLPSRSLNIILIFKIRQLSRRKLLTSLIIIFCYKQVPPL